MSDKFAGQTPADRERTRDSGLAGIVGIVLAGVVAVILAPGTFDWWTTLIGVVLSLVLIAFMPWPPHGRDLLGVITAGALCLLLVLGLPISELGWDVGETDEWRRERIEPAPRSGEQGEPPLIEQLNEALRDRGRTDLRPSSDPVVVLGPNGQPYLATPPGRGAGNDAVGAFALAWVMLFLLLLARRQIKAVWSRARGWLSSRWRSPPGQA